MRNVLVTGGAAGLGLAIVKRHIQLGDRVWALGRSESQEIKALADGNKQLSFILCDIASTQSVNAALTPRLGEMGALDCLYACAGVFSFDDRVRLTETDLDRAAGMYDINAVGFLRVVKAVFPAIIGGTRIICVSSEAGSISNNWRSREYAYCMSKAAENMACAILQKNFDEEGLKTRVICVHPGWMRTKMGGPDSFKRLNESVSPEESADALVDMALDMDSIPKEQMFMDYMRKPYGW